MIGIAALTIFIYLPVFYNLNIVSVYEYLEMRFERRIRTFATILYSVGVYTFQPIGIYTPLLAFSAGMFT